MVPSKAVFRFSLCEKRADIGRGSAKISLGRDWWVVHSCEKSTQTLEAVVYVMSFVVALPLPRNTSGVCDR